MTEKFEEMALIRCAELGSEELFMISVPELSGKNIKFTGEKPKGLLRKIFARNSAGHAYSGYLQTNDLPNMLKSIQLTKKNAPKNLAIEIPAFPSAACRISSIFLGKDRFSKSGQYVLITIMTDENSSFDLVLYYEDLCKFFNIEVKKTKSA